MLRYLFCTPSPLTFLASFLLAYRNLQEQHGAVEQDLANFHEEKREIDAQLAAIHNQRAAIEVSLVSFRSRARKLETDDDPFDSATSGKELSASRRSTVSSSTRTAGFARTSRPTLLALRQRARSVFL